MNIKNYIIPLTLGLITTWAIQYFVINRYFGTQEGGEIKSGQTFVAPQSAMEAQPLNREIDFIDEAGPEDDGSLQTLIETEHASYLFSSKGACLKQLTFKRMMNGKLVALRTIDSSDTATRENCCFLLALDKKTPYLYTLIDQKKLASATQLTYQAETDEVTVKKIFTIHHSKFQIDVALEVTPKQNPVQIRLFYNAPSMPEVKDDIISAVYNSQKGSIQKEAGKKLDLNKGWFAPTFFGSDNRYFVHAMVADQNKFAQRAYYSLVGNSDLFSILESAWINKPTEWALSFYFGPKEDAAMNVVDSRLEQTLDYSGLLAPLSRLLLMILKYLYSFLHNYGWAIVVMTLLINLVLLPFNIKSAQSMKKYAEFQKKLSYVQQRYKDDPDTLAKERTQLISKHGMPGAGGCLTKLLQLPIFFALSRVLSSSIELYKAPFIFWIHDLSARDPYYVLPILITLSMIFMSTTNDPKQRFTMIAVALIFGAASVNFSAGLCLYIFIGVVLTGIQTSWPQKLSWRV